MIRAVIDIGSNSTLFLIAQQTQDGSWTLLEESLTPNGLGWEMTETDGVSPEIQRQNIDIVKELINRAKSRGAVEIRAVGTAALRAAPNAQEFVDNVRRETGLEIHIISGQDEARLTYLGAMLDFLDQPGPLRVVDVGGGSSECVLGQGTDILESISLPVGAVSLTQSLISSQPLTAQQAKEIQHAVDQDLQELSHRMTDMSGPVIAVGGTAATLAAQTLGIELDKLGWRSPITLPHSTIREYWHRFAQMSVDDIAQRPHMPSDRARIITGGTAILFLMLMKLHAENVTLSSKGLRWGLLVDDTIQGVTISPDDKSKK
jgi:exopolyphosphatase/guanosine-5'-triphosphate,3'-diphosphate pyrophosphatase